MAKEVRSISRSAYELLRHGWAPLSSGNISLRSRAVIDSAPKQIIPLDPHLTTDGTLHGLLFWISRTGCTMEELFKDPEGNAGLYRVCERSLELLAGTGPPSTEVAVHMLVLSGTKVDAIVHCHWDDIGEISKNAIKGEFPWWIGVIQDLRPGSLKLAIATSKEGMDHRFIIWPYHGVVALGMDLDECLSTLEEAHGVLCRTL